MRLLGILLINFLKFIKLMQMSALPIFISQPTSTTVPRPFFLNVHRSGFYSLLLCIPDILIPVEMLVSLLLLISFLSLAVVNLLYTLAERTLVFTLILVFHGIKKKRICFRTEICSFFSFHFIRI